MVKNEYDKDTLELFKNILVDNHKSNPILMTLVSSALATIGLATNSQTTLIGSMLLSPIASFVVKNIIYTLLTENNIEIKEKYGDWLYPLFVIIFITLIVSFIFGKIFQNIRDPFSGKKLSHDWPTNEMKERARPINGIYMIFIALLCGIALPISLIMNSSTRLVAIGIATALIPPIANIGLSLSINNNNTNNNNNNNKNEEIKKYRNTAIITGICIFLVNIIFLWLPSKYIIKEISKSDNIFKYIEHIFLEPRILFNMKKYSQFAKLNTDSDAQLSFEEFSEKFKNKKTSEIRKIFNKIDVDNNGYIGINEWLYYKGKL